MVQLLVIFTSFLQKENLCHINSINKKKIDIPISYLSSDEIHALSDDINSNYEEETDSLMNDSDTKFKTAIEYSESDISEAAIQEKDNSNGSNFIPTKKAH